MAQLNGKVAVVTGAAAGIGRSTAELLLAEGSKVVMADIKEPAEGAEFWAKGKNSAFYQLDVSDPDQVKALINFAVERFSGLDIMVNNAGVVDYATVTETSDDLWHKMLAVNLSGVFYGIREAANSMKQRQVTGGSIVNVGSIAGLVGFNGLAAYCASKGGVTQLTKSAALDLASDGIRVNTVAPGPVDTDMTSANKDSADFKNMIDQNMPLGRISSPQEIAEAVLWLASDKASSVTGQVLAVDGGWTVR